MDSSRPDPSSETLFASWLGRGLAGQDEAFDALIAKHPEEEGALRELRKYWDRIDEALRAQGIEGSLEERLSSKFGSSTNPQVYLEDESDQADDSSSEFLARLQGRTPALSRYRLKGEVGRGGMGAVLRVWDEDLRRHLAMKVIFGKGQATETGETPAVDPRMLARFLEEAQITGQLDHPGIVPVHELGLDASGQVFFTMKLVKGRDLKAIFELVRTGAEGWTQTRALGVILKVCEAMSYAHAKKVLHRDLKPANIMVGRFGEVYVMDWGLAHVAGAKDTKDIRLQPQNTASVSQVHSDRRDDTNADSPLLTMDGDVVGTPAYMSPEQARGEIEAMGPASDVYSLGAILYQLLAGHMPFVPTGARLNAYAVWGLTQQGPPTPIAQLAPRAPEELVAICEKAMQRESSQRYPDTQAMAGDLQAFLEGRVVQAHRTGALIELRKWVSRNTALAGTLLAVLILVVGGSLGSSFVLAGKNDAIAFRNKEIIIKNEEIALLLRNAEVARSEAEDSRSEAEQARDIAERRSYSASFSAAEAARKRGDYKSALLHHQRCLEKFRGWEWGHQGIELDRSMQVLEEHSGSVDALTFSPDGRRIVSASRDNTLRIWDAETGESLQVLEGHADVVRAVAFSPDGERIVSGSGDDTLRIWDAETGESLQVLEGHTRGVFAVAFSPDSRRIVSGSWDKTLRIWDAKTREPLLVLEGHTMPVSAVAFSPDGRRIVSGSKDRTLRIWDAETGESLQIPKGHTGAVTAVAFSPDGKRIVSGSSDSTLRFWDAETGQSLQILEWHADTVIAVDFSPDGKRIVSGSRDQTVRIGDAKTGVSLQILEGHTAAVSAVAFSPDGRRLVSGSGDNTLRIWDAQPDDGLKFLEGHTGNVLALAVSPDGRRIVSGSEDNTLRIWDTEFGESLQVLEGHTFAVPAVAFSPDGRRIVSGSHDNTLRIWDTRTGEALQILQGHTGAVFAVAFSPDGGRIVSASLDRTLRIWDAKTGDPLQVLDGHRGVVSAVAYSPDGRRIASASWDRTLRIWDAESGKSLQLLEGHTGWVFAVAFSPDGGRLVSGSWDNTLRIWDPKTGDSLQVLEGHTSGVSAVAFSPNGRRIASGSMDKTVHIWDAETGESLQVLEGHTALVTGVAFSPDGKRIVSGSEDNTLRIWESDLEQARVLWRAQAKRLHLLTIAEEAWSLVDPDRSTDGDSVHALELAREVVALAPESAAVRNTLAWALFANDLREEALRTMQEALDLAKAADDETVLLQLDAWHSRMLDELK